MYKRQDENVLLTERAMAYLQDTNVWQTRSPEVLTPDLDAPVVAKNIMPGLEYDNEAHQIENMVKKSS